MEIDPLAPEGEDPFGGVPADAGDPPAATEPPEGLVQQGTLGGDNPSEEPPMVDPLAEEEGAALPPAEPEPEPEPTPVAEEPPPVAEEPPTPTPEPEPTPEPTPEPEPEPTPAEPESGPEPEQEEKPKAKKKPAAKKQKAKADGKRSANRDYVVLECDGKDEPVRIVGEFNARTDKQARKAAFDSMAGVEATRLVAIPARYWNVVPIRGTIREVKDVEEG